MIDLQALLSQVNKPASAATSVSTLVAASSASTVRHAAAAAGGASAKASVVKPGSGSTISRSSPLHHLSHNSDDRDDHMTLAHTTSTFCHKPLDL